jgi:ATP-binding cassette subfamily C protein CydD
MRWLTHNRYDTDPPRSLIAVKDLRAVVARHSPMTAAAFDPAIIRERQQWLNAVTADGGRTSVSATLLLLDTVAAIGFAAGLALAIGTIAGGTGSLWPGLSLAAGSGALRGIFAMLSVRAGAAGAEQAKLRLRSRVVDSALGRAPGSTSGTGTLVSAVVAEVDAIDGYVARFLPARRAGAVAPLIVLGATALASPVSTAILTVTLIPFVAAMILAGGAAADKSRRQFVALARLTGRFADRVRAMPIVLVFGAEEREASALGCAADELARRTMSVLRVAFLSSGALEFFAALSVALVAVYCGFALLGLLPFRVPETLNLARAFFVLALAPEFYGPMRRLAAAYHDKQAAETAAERLSAFPPPLVTSAITPVGALPSLVFDQVTIRYPDNDRDAVSGVSFEVPSGSIVALLGPSGSGKTSLLHLLLGLAPLSSGEVRVGGVAFPGTLAPHSSWAGQHPLIIAGSIADNLRLACPAATPDALAAVIRDAGLGPMLARRTHGIDSIVDARGSGLSGGERRRIALARALLKPAPILLLDEPTAHLDAMSEAALIACIARACKGRTVLIATHSERLAAIADHVVHIGACA